MSAAIGAFLKKRQVSSPICAEEYWVGKGYLFLGLWIRIIPSSVKAKSVWPFQQNLAEQMWGDDRNRCKLAWRLEKGRINSPKRGQDEKSSCSPILLLILLLFSILPAFVLAGQHQGCLISARRARYNYHRYQQHILMIRVKNIFIKTSIWSWWSYLPVTLSQTTTLLWSAATTNLIDCRKWQFDTSLGLTNWSLNIWKSRAPAKSELSDGSTFGPVYVSKSEILIL